MELFEVFKIAYATDEKSPSGLTFSGFCFALSKCADAIFSGPQWRDVYATPFSRIRLFFFWVEQGVARKNKSQNNNNNKATTKISFPGNVEKLTEGLKDIVPIESSYAKVNACVHEFQRAGIRFTHVDHDMGGIPSETPFLLPHVTRLDDALRRLFNWYARKEWTPTEDDGGFVLNSSQFARFVRDCGLRDLKDMSSGIVDIVYKIVTSSHDIQFNDTWKQNTFTKQRQHKSMKHRKMTYPMFYVALADIAVRKYVKPGYKQTAASQRKLAFALGTDPSSKISGETIRGALHQLILNNLLPIITKFWHKVGLDHAEGTAVVAGSPQRQRAINTFGDLVGRTPEKRAAGWEQKYTVVNHLEGVMKSSSVLRSFHLYEETGSGGSIESVGSLATAFDDVAGDGTEEKRIAAVSVATSALMVKETALLNVLLYGTAPSSTSSTSSTTTTTKKKKRKKKAISNKQFIPTTTTGYRPRQRSQPEANESISSASRRMSVSLSSTSVAGTQLLQDEGAAETKERVVASKINTKINIVDQALDHPSSPRAKQFMKELNDLHQLLEHVKKTASYDDAYDESMFVPPSATTMATFQSSNTRTNNNNPNGNASPARVQVHRSGSIDVSVYNRSPIMSELNGAAMENDEQDRALSSLLGNVRSKLDQLRSTIGAEALPPPPPPPPIQPSTPSLSTPPTPPLAEPNTPGISLDMRDLLEQEARNECEHGESNRGENNRGNDDHTMRMDEIGQSETKRNTKSIGRPPPTKSSILRQKLTHGEMKKPESSFIFPKSATKVQRNRRDSFMASSSLEQQWTAGRQEKHKDSMQATKNKKKLRHHNPKQKGGDMVPPPHVQRQLRRRAMGLPNRHAIQNQQSGWKPPVCGYSSFHVQGSKFAHADGPPTSSPKRKKIVKKKSPNKNTYNKKTSSSASTAVALARSASNKRQATSIRKRTTTEKNGEFEIAFSRELQVRVVHLRQVEETNEKDETIQRIEIAEQTDSIVHCRILLSRRLDDAGLRTVRVLLTNSDDVEFHYRHFADQQLFDSIKGKLKFDVAFDDYPQTLNDILESTTDPKEQTDLIFAIHADGRARLQAMKLLFGVRKVEILSLNFLKSNKETIHEYANGLL